MSHAGCQRFRRASRLRRPAEFLRVREEGSRFDSRFFLIRFAAASGDAPRLGLVVTKRIGNAVIRNQCKRRVRELFRLHPLHVPVDIVVVARRSLATAERAEVEAAWLALLRRIEKWRQQQQAVTDGGGG